jgi:flagellar P-ring protein precursor FlgI
MQHEVHPNMNRSKKGWCAVLWMVCAIAGISIGWAEPAGAARLKEIASVQGVRSNPLVGYGLVVGLDGTGDQTTSAPFTTQSLSSLLQQLGVTIPAGTNVQLKNVAAVMVTAQLPAFAQPGQTIDVNVSSLANAKSLRGGTLIATPLKGADGQIYAMAQGNLIVGGAGASAGGAKVQINHLAAGRIPEGASVERSVPTPLLQGDSIQLGLNASDYTTAGRVADAINSAKGPGTAQALDGRSVQVRAPTEPNARVSFIAEMEELPLQPSTPAAKVDPPVPAQTPEPAAHGAAAGAATDVHATASAPIARGDHVFFTSQRAPSSASPATTRSTSSGPPGDRKPSPHTSSSMPMRSSW